MKTTKKSRTSKTIETVDGQRLRLTPTRLLQIDHSDTLSVWYAQKESLRETVRLGKSNVEIHRVEDHNFPRTISVLVPFDSKEYTIGCCTFSPETFRLVLRWFGCRKSRALAAKAGV